MDGFMKMSTNINKHALAKFFFLSIKTNELKREYKWKNDPSSPCKRKVEGEVLDSRPLDP